MKSNNQPRNHCYSIVLFLWLALGLLGCNAPLTIATAIPTATSAASPTASPTVLPTIVPTPTLTLKAGTTYVNPVDGTDYAYVPAGEFIMGSENGRNNERPEHSVYLDGYWVMLTEVTNEQYSIFMQSGGYTEQMYWDTEGWTWRTQNNITKPRYWDDSKYNSMNQPVVGISWYEAQAYANWLSEETGLDFGLPSEAQWEKAARGTEGRAYPWGDRWDKGRVNSVGSDDGYHYPAPVGSYPEGASPYGLLDMAGNVREWTTDWYAKDYYQSSPEKNPQGAEIGKRRVVRGGSWGTPPQQMQTAYRFRSESDSRYAMIGFRLRLSSPPERVAAILTPKSISPPPIPTPVITIPGTFKVQRDRERGYLLAFPPGWVGLDVRSSRFQNLASTFGMGDMLGQFNDFLSSEAGQGVGISGLSISGLRFGELPKLLNVSVFKAPGATPELALTLVETYLNADAAMLDDVEIRDLAPAVVNNVPAVRGSAFVAFSGVHVDFFVKIVVLIANDKMYVLTLTTSVCEMARYEPIFDQIIGTFRPK